MKIAEAQRAIERAWEGGWFDAVDRAAPGQAFIERAGTLLDGHGAVFVYLPSGGGCPLYVCYVLP